MQQICLGKTVAVPKIRGSVLELQASDVLQILVNNEINPIIRGSLKREDVIDPAS